MISDRLAVYWDFEESGTRLDGVGGSDLIEYGSVPLLWGKLAPHSAAFDGNVANYLECPNNAAFNLFGTSCTIAGWVLLNNLSGTQHLLAKATGAAAAQLDYDVVYQGTGQAFKFIVSDGTNLATALLQTTAPLGCWAFFACTYEFGVGLKVRINDAVSSLATFTANIQDSGAALRLGNRAGSGALNGRLDALGIWKRLLSSEELDALEGGNAWLDHPLKGAI